MATNNPTVNLTSSSYGKASYVKKEASSGWEIVVTAVPNKSCVVHRIVMQCDAGQASSVDCGDSGDTYTFTTSGHSECSSINIYVEFLPVTEVKCTLEYVFGTVPVARLVTVNPPSGFVRFASPTESFSSQSFSVTPAKGWKVVSYDRDLYFTDDDEPIRGGAGDYSPAKTTTFSYSYQWNNHSSDHHGSSDLGEHSVYTTFTCERIDYVLTFDPNGGTCPEASRTLHYDDAYGALPVPSYPGNKFLGWYTARTGGTRVGADTKMSTSNRTVYAHWTAIDGLLWDDREGGTGLLIWDDIGTPQ